MNKDPLSDRLEHLLKNRDLNTLTPDEQQLVIRELGSLDAYARLRTIATKSQDVMNSVTISPSSAVLGNILTRVERLSPRQQEKVRIYKLPIPLYQVAASVILAIGITWWWAQSRMTPLSDPIVITLVDTVYQDKVRVDTFQKEANSETILTGVSTKNSKRSTAKRDVVVSHIDQTPDYRFSRGNHPVSSASRKGRTWQEQPIPFARDSTAEMDHLFVADRVL